MTLKMIYCDDELAAINYIINIFMVNIYITQYGSYGWVHKTFMN